MIVAEEGEYVVNDLGGERQRTNSLSGVRVGSAKKMIVDKVSVVGAVGKSLIGWWWGGSRGCDGGRN